MITLELTNEFSSVLEVTCFQYKFRISMIFRHMTMVNILIVKYFELFWHNRNIKKSLKMHLVNFIHQTIINLDTLRYYLLVAK